MHSCAKIRKDDRSSSLSAIAVGGGGALRSVEILDESSSTWRFGPYLPHYTCCAALVEDPRGGVILVGGYTPLGHSTSLYRLKHGGLNAQWELMEQKLKVGNHYITAFIIPDVIVQICTFN